MTVRVALDAEAAMRALKSLADDVQERAVDEALRQAGLVMQRGIQETLTESGRHSPGTPTPSAPGQPPAIVTGALRASVRTTDPKTGFGARYILVGPTMEYARIQELGGRHLPARPYIEPTISRDMGKVRDAFVAAVRRYL